MEHYDITHALYKAGSTVKQIAADLGVNQSAVSMVIHGNTKSFNIASRISVVTGIPVNKLWPNGAYDYKPHNRAA